MVNESTPSAAPAPLEIRRHDSDIHALGMAVNLLRFSEPFSGYAFGPFAGNLMGQIRRKHYFFTLSGKQVLGYAGWALCSAEVAEAWLAERYTPRFEECVDGPVFVGLTWFSAAPRVSFFQARALRRLFPGQRGLWRRDYGARRRRAEVFNPSPQAPLAAAEDFIEPH
jgi:hemolysin-activating ACP:hemolysin acyltransferase